MPDALDAASLHAEEPLGQTGLAFGGETVLSTIQSISYGLKTESPTSGTRTRCYALDFSTDTITVINRDNEEIRSASLKQGSIIAQGEKRNLPEEERRALFKSLTANFLYYLSARDLDLIGPEDIHGHGNLSWFRMRARDQLSPLVGLDPKTGRIVKVLGSNGVSVLELDYLKIDSGLVWPYRFIVHQDNKTVLEGHFFDLAINGTESNR